MNGEMRVRRRNGQLVPWKREKIEIALRKAFLANGQYDGAAPDIAAAVERRTIPAVSCGPIDIETIQDAVQSELLLRGYGGIAIAYAAYRRGREERRKNVGDGQGQQAFRMVRGANGEMRCWGDDLWREWLREPLMECPIAIEIDELLRLMLFAVPDEVTAEELDRMVSANLLRRSGENPKFAKFGAAVGRRFLRDEVLGFGADGESDQSLFQAYISGAVDAGLLDGRLGLMDGGELARQMDRGRDKLLDWNAFDMLRREFLLRSGTATIELLQWFWMRVAMGLCCDQPENIERIVELYGRMSSLEFCPSVPALLYAGTARPHLLSNYVYALEDSIEDIMVRGIAENAYASRWGAGLGGSWTMLRGRGASIGGSRRTSSGVVPFIELHRQQLAVISGENGRRDGAGCAYLDIWHGDVEEFIDLPKKHRGAAEAEWDPPLRTCLWVADLFMERLCGGVEWWTLFQPNDVPQLLDLWGDEFSAKYVEYEGMAERGEISSKRVPLRELWQKILACALETGFPSISFGDNFQRLGGAGSAATIRSSSLHGDGAMAMVRGETACGALGAISIPSHLVDGGAFDWDRFKKTIAVAVGALDSSLSLTHFPSAGAEMHCKRLRGLGLSVAGMQDALRLMGIPFHSAESELFASAVFEALSHGTIRASSQLAVERGPIACDRYASRPFPGEVPDRAAPWLDWRQLHEMVEKNGLRNAYFVAQTSSAAEATILTVSRGTLPAPTNVRTLRMPSGERLRTIDANLVKCLERDCAPDGELFGAICHLDGDLCAFGELPPTLCEVFSTAFDCPGERFIAIGAAIQRRIDQCQHLPLHLRMPTFFQLSSLIQLAWRSGIGSVGPLSTTHGLAREKALEGMKSP
ncbi:MAG: hypothetical protein LBI39_02740 [Puniceicoccales bacterium]|jgi:ribonucleoside-diphosphate reductase alpha chain|nr:hypothetical protein [Puniceicoccales bacterium]